MAWREVTEADVRTKLSDAELARYRGIAAAAGRADPVPTIIAAVVNHVRGFVDASGRYALGTGTTVPEKLVDVSCIIIRQRILNNLPGAQISKERNDEYAEAKETLALVGAGKFGLEEPETATTESSSTMPGPKFVVKTRTFDRYSQDGT